LLPQFHEVHYFRDVRYADALRQILWGLFKKVVIADNLAADVSRVFDGYQGYDSVTLLLGSFFFAIQIYCDFSGYSDIAIGVARLLGFKLTRNFAYPYFSRDIGEFWRRWHISLSSWFRDYVYIPLGGSFVGTGRRIWNIVVTFTVSGLWHGANWTFVIWGFLNGAYYIPLMLTETPKQSGVVAEGKYLPSLRETRQLLVTFGITLLAWVFFRARSAPEAVQYLFQMVTPPFLGTDLRPFVPSLAWGCFLLLFEWFQREREFGLDIPHYPRVVRWTLYVALCLGFVLFGNFGSQEFIYFQF